MLKRTSKIYAKDNKLEIEITIRIKQKEFGSYAAVSEASSTLKRIEDEITENVFTKRYHARNIQFSA
jgi:hypothetical protein